MYRCIATRTYILTVAATHIPNKTGTSIGVASGSGYYLFVDAGDVGAHTCDGTPTKFQRTRHVNYLREVDSREYWVE